MRPNRPTNDGDKEDTKKRTSKGATTPAEDITMPDGRRVVIHRGEDSPPPVMRKTMMKLPDGRHCLVVDISSSDSSSTGASSHSERPTGAGAYGGGKAGKPVAGPSGRREVPGVPGVDLNFVTVSLASISGSVGEAVTAFNKVADNIKETGRHLRAVNDKVAVLKEVVGYHPLGTVVPLRSDGRTPGDAVEQDELRKKLSEMTAKAGIYRRETNQKDDHLNAIRKSYSEWKVFTDRQVARMDRELDARRVADGLNEDVIDALEGVEQSLLRLRIAIAGGTHGSAWFGLPDAPVDVLPDAPVDVSEEVEENVDVESVYTDVESVDAEASGGEPPKKNARESP